MDELAQGSSGGVYHLPQAHVDGAELDMSFSGLKTAVVNLAHHARQVGEPLDRRRWPGILHRQSAMPWFRGSWRRPEEAAGR